MSDTEISKQLEQANARIQELEMRTTYMDETIESLNEEVARLTSDFELARQAMRLMNQRLEQVMQAQGMSKSPSDDAPPPHY